MNNFCLATNIVFWTFMVCKLIGWWYDANRPTWDRREAIRDLAAEYRHPLTGLIGTAWQKAEWARNDFKTSTSVMRIIEVLDAEYVTKETAEAIVRAYYEKTKGIE